MSNSSIENCNLENGTFIEKSLKNTQLEINLINQNNLINNNTFNENYENNIVKQNTSLNQFKNNQFNFNESLQYLIEENISLPIIFNKNYTLSFYTDLVYLNKKLLSIKNNKINNRNKINNTANKYRSLILHNNNEKQNNNLSSNFLIAKLNFLGQIKSGKTISFRLIEKLNIIKFI